MYSTCSFNPIENEAVVQAALLKFKGKVRLLNVSAEVSSHLKYREGLTKWRVFHRQKSRSQPAAWYYTYDSVPENRRGAIRRTMFNSIYTEINNNSDY